MKIAISIPDDLFRQAERLAKTKRISRSQLYVMAISRLLREQPNQALTEVDDAAFDDREDDRPGFVEHAGRRALLAVEWEEQVKRGEVWTRSS